ncbi:MAG: molybdenum cofactor biosysynthesis protein [Verrucomicrobiota bacterium]
MQIVHLYVSPGHNYFGHHGAPPGDHPAKEMPRIQCLDGRGIVGDRFLDFQDDYKGQVTFFAIEMYENLCAKFGVKDRPPSVFRRNIITRNADLNALIGEEFEIQGLRFLGMSECSPCHWMDQAFCPGTEAALKNCGGLRAKILTSGWLSAG